MIRDQYFHNAFLTTSDAKRVPQVVGIRKKTVKSGATLKTMSQQPPPKITLVNTEQYREDYANSVQIRISVWDFLLVFGRIAQTAPDSLTIHNSTGVYMSPQQSKALLNLLQQNVNQYEATFGPISLEQQPQPGGIVQ